MKKTFQLHIEGKNRYRLLDASKHEIRKYLARERRKALPEGVDYWDFDCLCGASAESASVVHVAELTRAIDAATADGAPAFFVAISAKPGVRKTRPSDGEPG